jgi:plasmid stabilization system protein ParE
MKYEAEYLMLAREDVRQISQYLSQFYPSTCAKFLTQLITDVETLRENPYQYAVYPGNPKYRRMPFKISSVLPNY